MKKKFAPGFTFAILFFFLFTPATLKAQTPNGSARKKTIDWYNRQEWLNGLKLTPHKSIDKEEFAKEYSAHKIWWDKAFAFLKDTDLASLKPGEYAIVGTDVFARVTEVQLKDLDSSKWEAHKNFHDIHYVITGKEKIGIGPVSSATVIVPYDDKRDIAFYSGKGNYYIADQHDFFIAFTKNIHRPGLKIDEKSGVKKLVIKVRSSDQN